MNRSSSSLSLRAGNLFKLNQRRSFLKPLSSQRKGLRIEALETRAVFAVTPMGFAPDCTAPTDLSDEVHVVFAPDTPPATVQAYEDLAHRDGIDAFSFGDTDRWSRTATNSTTLTQGDATVIRWSVVPDGTPISGYNGEPAAPSNLRSWLAGIYGSNPNSTLAADQPWFDEMQSVFDRWSAVSGVTYVYESADDGRALGSQYGGSINVRGDVRISGHYIDGPSNILAYNFYPTVGDMVLDTGDTFFNNTGSNSIRLRNTMAHEAGHGLGLGHVTPVNGTKLMEPSISLAYDGPQADDILAVNRGYGDRLEKSGGNNTAATATALTGNTFTVDTISIDDDSDVDWFRFTVGAGSSVSVTVTPTGSTYTSNSVTFNSLTQSNLAFSIYSGNGTTVLTTVNATAAGLAETLSNYNLSAAGTYYVRVSGSANAAQMYRLSGTISGATTPAAEIAVLDGQTNIADNTGSVSLGTVNVGATSTKTFTIQNLGNANLTLGSVSLPAGFVLTQAPLTSTVAAGASTTFIVSLDTTVAGTFSGALTFTNNDADENPFNFSLAGTVTTPAPLAPEITVLDGTANVADNTGSISLGSVAVGGSASKVITIRNDGTANLTLDPNITLPTGFTLAQGPALTTLPPGQSTSFRVALDTTTVGSFSGQVSFANDDANENPFNFTISGTVTDPVVLAPEISVSNGVLDIADNTGSLDFGAVAFGGTSSKVITVRNLGNGNLQLGSISVPAGFTLTQPPGVSLLTPGLSTTFTISLDTSAAGTFSGQVSFTNSDADENPFNFTVSGTVNTAPTTAPEIEILDGTTNLVDGQSTVSFGSAQVGGTLSKTFTIRNTGTASLTLTNIVLPTAYSLTAGPGSTTIAPGASTTITLTLNTASAGTFTGAVALNNNDANEGPFNFNVTGTVTATPTTPTTFFSDNFNRSNNSSLGNGWTERSGNFSITNQGLQSSSSGTSLATVNNVSIADVILTADVNLGTGTAGRDAGLVARHSGNGDGSQYWGGIAYSGGRYYAQIWESNNGSWTRLSQTQISSGSVTLKFEVIGTTLKLYVNGTLSVSATDSTLTTGRIGLSAIGSGMRLDNFVAQRPVAPLVAPAASPADSTAPPAVKPDRSAAAVAGMNTSAQQLAALDQLLALWGLQNGQR